MPYVTRDENNQIIAVFSVKQYEGQEYLDKLPEDYLFSMKLKEMNNSIKTIFNRQYSNVCDPITHAYCNSEMIGFLVKGFDNLTPNEKERMKTIRTVYALLDRLSVYKDTLQTQINDASTLDDLNSIDLNSGWPI